MFQVLVKTTQHMLGSYSYDLGTREAAQSFVQRPDVWWYTFPADEDALDGSCWRKGGAQAEQDSAEAAVHDADTMGIAPPPPVPDEDDEDDERW